MQYAYDNRVVQLGYGYCNPIPGATCAIGNAGPHFVWTPNDHNLLLASADGAGKYGGTPVLHHRYRFKIYPDGTQQKWWYCIRDVSTGEAYRCWWVLRWSGYWGTDGTGSNVWWGAETVNSNDQMGNAAGTTEIGMQWMQYKKVGAAQYIVIDGLGAATKKPSTNFPTWYRTTRSTPTIPTETDNSTTSTA